VIDETGQFRVKWGNTSSHAAMAGRMQAAAAGRFSVNRQGQVYHVVCTSTDYRVYYDRMNSTSAYVINAFKSHTAFALHDDAVFQFHKKITEKFFISARGEVVPNSQEQIQRLENEGSGGDVLLRFDDIRRDRFLLYLPPPPPRLYPMHLDQAISSLETDDDMTFDYGPAAPRFDLRQTSLRSGKNNFVLDQHGWLIIGMVGHQILSGGNPLGGAGHLHIEPGGQISRVDLNFSGHYRPSLTADYARYCYRVLAGHPLLPLVDSCRFFGRVFDENNLCSTVIQFSRDELESDSDELVYRIESLHFS
jgi:hypothetical protein